MVASSLKLYDVEIYKYTIYRRNFKIKYMFEVDTESSEHLKSNRL